MDDCGGAFTMGVIGGGVFQALKGFRNAPAVSPRPLMTSRNRGGGYWWPRPFVGGA